MSTPDKDPSLLSAIVTCVWAWASDHSPAIQGFILSVVIAFLRVIYAGGGMQRSAIEAALCGAISVAVMSALDLVGLPASASGFIGGGIGFLGVQRVQDIAEAWLSRRGVNDGKS